MMASKPYRRDPAAIAPEALSHRWSPTHRQLIELWLDIARRSGYLVSVYHDSRGEHWGADSGLPDLLMVRDGRAYAIEVKVPPDEPTAEQRIWLSSLDAVPGITAGIWRSSGDRVRDAQSIADILGTGVPVLPRGTR